MRDNTIDDPEAHSHHHRLRQAGRHAATQLPPVNADTYRWVAELLREPINRHISAQRQKGRGSAA
jgi:hypothetical protein